MTNAPDLLTAKEAAAAQRDCCPGPESHEARTLAIFAVPLAFSRGKLLGRIDQVFAVERRVGRGVKEWRLQNRRRECDLIHQRVVIGVDCLWVHAPQIAVHRSFQPLQVLVAQARDEVERHALRRPRIVDQGPRHAVAARPLAARAELAQHLAQHIAKHSFGKHLPLSGVKQPAEALLGVTKAFDGDDCGYVHGCAEEFS